MAGCGDGDSPTLMGDHPAARGLAALREGRAAEALGHFEQLIAAEPNGVPGHFLRIEALDHLGDVARARTLLGELLTRFPFAAGACHERLAIFALRENAVTDARAHLEKAVASGWANPDAVTSDRGWPAHASDAALLALLARARANAAAAAD